LITINPFGHSAVTGDWPLTAKKICYLFMHIMWFRLFSFLY